jgi:hypothetical protein
VLEAIEKSDYAQWMLGESLLGWPTMLTIHAFGTAVVLGFIFIMDLRLIGFFRTIPYTALLRLFPLIWISVVFQVISGVSLWTTKPTKYVGDGAFLAKFSFVVLGFIVTVFFYRTLKREAANWDATGNVSARGIKFVGATFLLWAAVLIAGRLTAYLGQLYAA